MTAPDSFIVRFLGPDGEGSAGTGALVGPGHVVTCAHVVNAALGLDPRAQGQPAGPVRIEFPFLGGAARRTLTARVAVWRPPPKPGGVSDDVTGLVIEGDLPDGAVPALLAADTPQPGAVLRVYGFPPDLPEGCWAEAVARGTVPNRRLQLDSTLDSARPVKPGFSGGPVIDDSIGRVVGLIAEAGRAAKDSRAVSADMLRDMWPEVLGSRAADASGHRDQVTILHVCGTRFGRSDGALPPEALSGQLRRDLAELGDGHGLRPDLLVVSGDLANRGMPREYGQAAEFLAALAGSAGIPRRRVAIVPGSHDVNPGKCRGYFFDREGEGQDPLPPYFPKWLPYAKAFKQFYEGTPGITFTPDQPWTLFEMPEIGVVVAGLNSTMAESHLDEDRYGLVGPEQLRWFATRLAEYQRRGWLRVAAVHHGEPRDADDLDRALGRGGLAHLLLHGGAETSPRRLPSGLSALSTGGPRYQLITIRRDGITRHARRYSPGQQCWVGDTRISASGRDWQARESRPLADADFALPPGTGPRQPEDRDLDKPPPRHSFLDRVEEATRVRYGPRAVIVKQPDRGYLRVTSARDSGGEGSGDSGGAMTQWPIGVVDGPPTETDIDTFADGVHRQFAAADPSLESELVYGAPAAPAELVSYARRLGIRLKSLVEYQGLVDLSGLAAKQRERLAADRLYQERLYIEQRYRVSTSGGDGEVCLGLVDRAVGWMAAEDTRLVVVLGDFGRGKTAFLRQLTRVLPTPLPGVTPILIELRRLEKAPRLEELLSQHLVRQGVENFHLPGLRYMIKSGRVALLFDGFDELELRVGFEHAAEYLLTLLGSVSGRAKVILTSRTQHFRSANEVRTALGKRVETRIGSRVVVLEEFSDEQIAEFLTRLYDGDRDRAWARLDLISGIGNLRDLAHNPRMLTFIANLGEDRLRAAQDDHGQVSAAGLYKEIIDNWLEEETKRKRHESGLPGITEEERFRACTALALRLWRSKDPTIARGDLSSEVAETLSDLLDERGYTEEQAAHSIASGSLLIRTDDGTFDFIHRSIMEWFVAEHAARELTRKGTAPTLGTRPVSRLTAAFFADLAGPAAARWAAETLTSREAAAMAKENALTVARQDMARAGLRGLDLRGQDLNGKDLTGADLSRANLSGMRFDGTDLTGADLSEASLDGVTMIGGSIHDATLTGSTWTHAVLLGTDDHGCRTAPELSGAAIAGRDNADPMFHSTGRCTSVAYSPGGTLLAIARGSAVELADTETGKTLRVLRGHAGLVTAVAYSPDGTRIATASNDHTARIWDTATGTVATTLTGHGSRVNAVAFSPDGTRIATASDDHTARIWNAASGTTLALLTGHGSWVGAVAYSPDGTRIATASDDHTARIWNAADGTEEATLTGHSFWVNAVAYSPDGTHLATASNDHTVKIWDTATGTEQATFTGHDERVNAVAFSPDGTRIATASDDGTIRVWDVTNSTDVNEMSALTGHDNWARAVTFSPDGTRIATASDDGTARIWDTATGTVATTLTGHDSRVNAVAYSPRGTHLATASDDGTACVWNAADGTEEATLTGHDSTVTAIAYSPRGTHLATGSNDGTIRIWDVIALANVTAAPPLTGHSDCIRAVAYSPGGTQLASASDDRTARIWDAADGSALAVLGGHGSWVLTVAYSPGGTLLATGSYDGNVRLWKTASFQTSRVERLLRRPPSPAPEKTVQAHLSAVRSLAFHPSGTRLATASTAGTVRIWDVTDLTNVRKKAELAGHAAPVRSVAYSPDGDLLATASDDGTIRIWSPSGTAALATLLPLPEGGYATLLPDGSYKLSGDPGDRLWWAIKLCRFAPGELDPYVPGLRRLDDAAPIIQPPTGAGG